MAAHRFMGEHVVQADHLAFLRELPAGQRHSVAVPSQREALVRHGRVRQAQRVAGDVVGWRAAQSAHGLRKGKAVQGHPVQTDGQTGGHTDGHTGRPMRGDRCSGPRRQCGQNHHAGGVHHAIALGCQFFVQPRRLCEGRQAKDHGQAGRCVNRRCQCQLPGQRQATGGERIDAAGPARLTGQVAHQPAVQPTLLRRGAGVEAGVFHARHQGVVKKVHRDWAAAQARWVG